MKINLTPVVAAISFWITGQLYAAGGVAGENGISQIGADTVDLIGSKSVGKPGGPDFFSNTAADTTEGENGGDIGPITRVYESKVIAGQPGQSGKNGGGTENREIGGGGVGGTGGASVIGGISIGGAGGDAGISTNSSANGGAGGSVSTVHTTLDNVSLDGINAFGGNGGSTSSGGKASGGAAGHGGGSVFGGISTGGAGGTSISVALPSANGGNGGSVSANTIVMTDSELAGAFGGDGGISSPTNSAGGGGAGGHGGGSVFGGISTGGSGGHTSYATTFLSAHGGNGGSVSDNTIEITNSTLTGAFGGVGGSFSSATYSSGGGGAAGNGGGSVFGGISTGGAGGFSNSSSSSFSLVNGGDGGRVSANKITLHTVQLNGKDAAGGDGGSLSMSSSGGGGAAGHGGGSVFGGISTGGASGFPNSTLFAYGGAGGSVSANIIDITDSTLIGASGGSGGGFFASGAGGGGVAGNGGGSVFGGISTGGSGGFSRHNSQSSSPALSGGAGGGIADNKITLHAVKLNGKDAVGGVGGGMSSTTTDPSGSGGAAGNGGGSVFGGISTGGGGGYSISGAITSALFSLANGGDGGRVSGNIIGIADSTLSGAAGGAGGSLSIVGVASRSFGGGGAAGHGGGSVFGGISTGGAGGYATNPEIAYANGGAGASVSDNIIEITDSTFKGAAGGIGGSLFSSTAAAGGGGSAGHGGGSVFGGISTGGSGGYGSLADGGAGGSVADNKITLHTVKLDGKDAAGGNGGGLSANSPRGSGGAAGHGGGSVFGGVSTGGAGGFNENWSSSLSSSLNGGAGGRVSGNKIEITNSTFIGSQGGNGSSLSSGGGGGAAGHGGASVFGGISTGGAGGYSSRDQPANGGAGGSVVGNEITLHTVQLDGIAATGGAGGKSTQNTRGGGGANGYDGGSVFGGISTGGAGGYSNSQSADGGNSGDVVNNKITIEGLTKITGSIYGGISQGGAKGGGANAEDGIGGNVTGNTITLIGNEITIDGSIYGGRSINGAGIDDDTKAFSGNTLNPVGYKGSVQGLYNIENFNWVLPREVANQDALIQITGADKVKVDNTKHSVAMYNDGKQLNGGDQILMIKNQVAGTALLTTPKVRQGLFLVYDVSLDTIEDDLVLSIVAKEDITPDPGLPDPGLPKPGGNLHPTSKSYLQGRLATLATLNQGADLVVMEDCRTNVFGMLDGGSNRYDTGSHIKVHDISMVLGGSKCLELQSKSTVMLGAFVQHGNSNYDSYNSFGGDGDVHGWGKVNYTGAGLVFHMNVAGTGSSAGKANVSQQDSTLGNKDGLYFNASVSAGKAKTRFNSDMVDVVERVRGQYESKSNYATAMAGTGYAWKIDDKQLLDFYGRYSWAHLGSDSVMMGNDQLHFGSMHSSRVHIGARYSHAMQAGLVPYVGLGYEHEFNGNASGKAYGMSIDQLSLKGSSGVVEVGVNFKPSATNQAWTVNAGIQGYFGERKGASGGVKVRYAF